MSSEATTSEDAREQPQDAETEESRSSPSPSSSSAASSSVAKTPVSLLQELYVRRGVTPKYDLVQIEGAVHEPTFKYRVAVGEFVATGSGQSKKKAKHSAAKAVLERIRHSQQRAAKAAAAQAAITMQADGENGETAVATAVPAPLPDIGREVVVLSPYADGIEGNPVGELQELCMNRRTQPPSYEVSLEEGQPHERKFAIVCSVGTQSEAGLGKSKKLAKRQAASKMLRRLKEQPAEVGGGAGGAGDSALECGGVGSGAAVDDDELAQGIAAMARGALGGVASSNGETRQAQAMRVDNFYRNLKPTEGSELKKLQELSQEESDRDPCSRLERICEEQDFTATFVELEEEGKKGERMCLLQLSTVPVAVCFGSAADAPGARERAAANALLFLKIMTRTRK